MDMPIPGGPDYSGKKGFDVKDLFRKKGIIISFTAEDGTEHVDEWDTTFIMKKGLNVNYLSKLWDDNYVKTSGNDFDRTVDVLDVDPVEFAAFLMYKNACADGTMEPLMIPDPNPRMIPDYVNGWKGAYLAELKGEIPEEEEEVEDEEEFAEDEEDSSDL